MNFNLTVIHDKEFEEICKALMEKELGIPLQIFKKGTDNGIDLRFAGNTNNEIVIQAKHYINSKFSDLKYALGHIEKPNIKKMMPIPQRYIVTTSLGLKPSETDNLVEVLTPYVRSTDDIYGGDRILELLRDNPEIVKKFYKLWLTSSEILQRILFNGATGRSEFFSEKILQKVGLYVQTSDFDIALERLKEKHFIIITGEPGIGKTTTAYLMICSLLANGYELIYVEGELKDAEDLISSDPEKKQVIFYDDFLGSNIYDLMYPKNTETSIVNIIERIQTLRNKLLVLTTRTTILNQATFAYAKLKRSGVANISQYEIKLTNYSKYHKALILYNHLFQSKNSEELFQAAISDKNYIKIIKHPNYSPRLIEFITKSENFRNSRITNLVAFIFHHLDHPEEIWRDAYENQISDEERFLLTTLLSFGGYTVSESQLKPAFDARYEYEIKTNGFKLMHNAFNACVKKLLDGLIVSSKNIQTGLNVYSFINPSLGDFLLHDLNNNEAEKWRILCGIKFTTQLTTVFDPRNFSGITLSKEERHRFFPVFLSKAESLIPSENEQLHIDLAYLYLTFFKDLLTDEILIPVFTKCLEKNSSSKQFLKLNTALEKANEFNGAKDLILSHWTTFIGKLLHRAADTLDFQYITELFEQYECSLDDYMADADNRDDVELSLILCFQNANTDEDYSTELENIYENYHTGYSSYAVDLINDRIHENYDIFLNDCGFSDFALNFKRGTDIDASEILRELIRQHQWDEDHHDNDDDYYPSSGERSNDRDDERAIDELFER